LAKLISTHIPFRKLRKRQRQCVDHFVFLFVELYPQKIT